MIFQSNVLYFRSHFTFSLYKAISFCFLLLEIKINKYIDPRANLWEQNNNVAGAFNNK